MVVGLSLISKHIATEGENVIGFYSALLIYACMCEKVIRQAMYV
jgi:hypothetical protein